MYKVYLAGPIAGHTFDSAQDWRSEFAAQMPPSIICYSPLRGKRYVGKPGTAINVDTYNHPLANDRSLMVRDFWDCQTADLIVAHLGDATAPSLGTCMELAFAYTMHKPVVATLLNGGPHDHPMVREAITHRASSLKEAAEIVRFILLPNID